MRRYGFIPARAGSQRLPGKNLRLLGGHPLLAYAIHAAVHACPLDGIYVSTEDAATASVATHYGIGVIDRPVVYATQSSPDVEWLRHACDLLRLTDDDEWIIVRPTNPFRTADTLRRAIAYWTHHPEWDSMRTIQAVSEHPDKMWLVSYPDQPMHPLFTESLWGGTPAHSSPTQRLRPVYVQNAALDIGRVRNLRQQGTIHGTIIGPFFTTGYEGVDINTPDDWAYAKWLVASGAVVLPDPSVAVEPLLAVSPIE